MSMSNVWAIVFIGMTIVFIALSLLILVVLLFSKIFNAITVKKNNSNKGSATKKKNVPATTQITENSISDEIVAVIAAAIAAMSDSDTKYSIRRIKKVKTVRPVWSMAGLQENTRSF